MKTIAVLKHIQLVIVLSFLLLFLSCNRSNDDADAYGNFESNEIIVSAQYQGILAYLDLEEGDVIPMAKLVGKIDTALPIIKKEQLMAQHAVINAKLQNLEAQLKVQEEQRINLAREVGRMEKLFKESAATEQQFEDITGKLKVLDSQTEAIRSQKSIILGEKSVLSAQLDEIYDLLHKCRIICPVTGTVLEKYVEAGELVSPGKGLFKIADLENLELKVYVSGAQLPSVVLGDTVAVMVDSTGETMQRMKGVVSWISSEVEFTPKIIQTREERINMVYAVKVRVSNDGRLKIGMPGEVVFGNR
jgi:HlyD family secretion protein